MPLSPEDKTLLSNARVALLGMATTSIVYQLLDWLYSLRILLWDDRQMVLHEITDGSRMMTLLTIYEKRALNLDPLRQALRQLGISSLRGILGDVSPEASPMPQMSRSLSARFPELATIAKELKHFYSVSFKSFRPIPHTNSITSFSIDEIWVNVRLESQSRHKERDIDDSYSSRLLSAFKHGRLVVCCGKAGYGKTCLMRRITYDWSQGKLPEYDLVLCAKLREVGEAESILDIAIAWMSMWLPENCLSKLKDFKGNMVSGPGDRDSSKHSKFHSLAILDGLDESNMKCVELQNFLSSQELKDLGFDLLVTCLPHVCGKIYAPYQSVSMAGFDKTQQSEYFDKHFQHDEDKLEKTTEVVQLLESSTSLASLAEVPLLLSSICIVYETLQLGTSAEVFERVCQTMIVRYIQKHTPRINVFGERWKESKIIVRLGKLALHVLLKEDGTEHVQLTDQELLEGGMGQKATFGHLIRSIHLGKNPSRKRICCLIGFLTKEFCWVGSNCVKVYSFPHRTMQEFFASLYLQYKSSLVRVTDGAHSQLLLDHTHSGWVTRAKGHFNQWQLIRVYNFFLELAMGTEDSTVKNTLAVYTYLHPAFSANYLMFSGQFDENLYQISTLSPFFFKLYTHFSEKEGLSAELMHILIAKSNPNEIRETLPYVKTHTCILGSSLFIKDFNLLICISKVDKLLSPVKIDPTCRENHLESSFKHCIVESSCWRDFVHACQEIHEATDRPLYLSRLQVHLDQLNSAFDEIPTLNTKLTIKKLSVFIPESMSDPISLQQFFEVLLQCADVTSILAIHGGHQTISDLAECYALIGQSIEVLNLLHLNCPDTQWDELLDRMCHLKRLQHLTIRNCHLTELTLSDLAHCTKELGLETLVLASEPALRKTKTFEMFCTVLADASNLRDLGLCGGVLTTESMDLLVAMVRRMPQLSWLSIYDNQIPLQQLEMLRRAVMDNEHMQLIF